MTSIGQYFNKALSFNNDRRQLENQLNQILYGNLINFQDVVFYNYCREDFIIKGYKSNAEVYSIVKKIVDKMSFAPLYTYNDNGDEKAKRYKSCKKSVDRTEHAKYKIYRTKALDFVPDTNELAQLIEKPNDKQSWNELIELFRIFYFVQGEAFLYRETAEDSDIALNLNVAPANLMEPVFGGTIDDPITGWRLNLLNGQIRTLGAKDVFQLKMANPEFDSMGGQLRGMSPLQAGQKYLQLDDTAVKAWLNSTVNEGAKGLISPNHADPKLWLNPSQVDALQDSIETKIHGTDNKNKVVASAMPLQYTAIGLSPQALAIIDGLKYSNVKLCDLWGVPAVLFDPNPTYQNMKEAKERFVSEVIIPYLNKEESALNRWLVEPFIKRDKKEYVLDYDTSVYEELKLDLEERKALSEILSINEMRVLEGWDELPEEVANQVFIASGKVPLNEFDLGLSLNDDVSKSFSYEDYQPVVKAEIPKGCLMFYPDIDINDWVNGIRKLVPNHIVEEYEFEPHLTVLYGFDDSKMNTGRLKFVVNEFLKDNAISIQADRIGVFSNEQDIIKINVEDLNGNLTRLNRLIKDQFDYENDYPDYKPHITVAYSQKGSGAYLDGALIDLKDYGLKDLNSGIMKYSDSRKNKTMI